LQFKRLINIYGGNIQWEDLTTTEEIDPVDLIVDLTGDSEAIQVQEKCTRLFALNANKNVKFHSNLQKANQFIAKNVLEREEDSKSRYIN